MFINFWYPASESEALLKHEPLKVRILGQDLVLWRDDDGQAHCVSNTCTHRGGSLGDGKVVGDCIQCPYHGWVFSGSGACERIPSLGPVSKIPPRSKIDAYPVDERYGLTFVFLGDLPEGERPTIMENTEWGKEGWRAVRAHYRWKANYVRLVENQCDPSHVEYVHSGFGMGGKRKDYQVPRFEINETAWGAGAMTEFISPELPDQDMKQMQGEGKVDAGSGFHGAACTWTRIKFNENDGMNIYLYACPHEEDDLTIYLINERNCMLEEKFDKNYLERIMVAVEEDRVVIEKLNPPVPSREAIGEFIVPADDILMVYRNRLAEWQSRGWRIDVPQMKSNEHCVAYAIPGPQRRTDPYDWAVTPVPMQPIR